MIASISAKMPKEKMSGSLAIVLNSIFDVIEMSDYYLIYYQHDDFHRMFIGETIELKRHSLTVKLKIQDVNLHVDLTKTEYEYTIDYFCTIENEL